MNEFIRLREFGAGVPGPSPEESNAARAALLAAIEAAPPLHQSPLHQGRASRRAGSRPMRFALAAGAAAGLAAVAAGVAAGLVGAGGSSPAPQHAQLTAAVVLRQAAFAAARQAPASGRVFFAESEYVDLSGGAAIVVLPDGTVTHRVVAPHWSAPALRRFWLSRRGGGLVEDPAAGPRPVRVHGGIPVSSRVPLPGGGFEVMGQDYVSWRQLSQLPTAQVRLRAYIEGLARQSGVQPVAAAEFQAICQLLYESPAPPAVRAALYDLAATLPGAKLIPRARDILGRVVTEVYLGGQALLFSRATGAVMGEAGLSGSGPGCPPRWASAVLAIGYVGSLGQELHGAPSAPEPTRFPHSVPGCRRPGQATR